MLFIKIKAFPYASHHLFSLLFKSNLLSSHLCCLLNSKLFPKLPITYLRYYLIIGFSYTFHQLSMLSIWFKVLKHPSHQAVYLRCWLSQALIDWLTGDFFMPYWQHKPYSWWELFVFYSTSAFTHNEEAYNQFVSIDTSEFKKITII